MQRTSTSTTPSTLLSGIKEGNRYSLRVTGATKPVSLEFQHVPDGDWFPEVGFTSTPQAGVVSFEFICVVPRMRVSVASGQVGDWTISWVKHTTADT